MSALHPVLKRKVERLDRRPNRRPSLAPMGEEDVCCTMLLAPPKQTLAILVVSISVEDLTFLPRRMFMRYLEVEIE